LFKEVASLKLTLKILLISLGMALIAGCGNIEWFPDTSTPTLNTAPVANAGTAQRVFIGDTVTLNGSASSDANGDSLTYLWSLTAKPNESKADLSSTIVGNPTFIADLIGDYNLSLIVNDGKISSAASLVTVTVTPFVAIVANAGKDQKVPLNALVTLDGSGSTDKRGAPDVNGDKLKYVWAFIGADSKPSGAGTVVLIGSTGVKPTFTPTVSGIYKITLRVNDPTDLTSVGSTDEVIVSYNLGAITVEW
jgi:hypothetical protein